MRLNKSQYQLLRKIAELEKTSVKNLAFNICVTLKKAYKNLKVLKTWNLIEKEGKLVCLTRTKFSFLLTKLLLEHPEIEKVIADSGLDILALIEQSDSIQDLTEQTKIPIPSIYRYLRNFALRGIIRKKDKFYQINDKLWPDIQEFIRELKFEQLRLNQNIPRNARIYLDEPKRIIFSTDINVNSTPTAFSRYSDFGIKVFEAEKIYHWPAKKLNLKDIFLDSLSCLNSIRRKILCTFFYLKYKSKLKSITHPEMKTIKRLLNGEKVENYPSLNEIKEKAEIYDIQI